MSSGSGSLNENTGKKAGFCLWKKDYEITWKDLEYEVLEKLHVGSVT